MSSDIEEGVRTQVLVPLLVLGVHRVRRDPDIAGYGAVTVHLPITSDGVEVAMDRHHAPEVLHMELDARGGRVERPLARAVRSEEHTSELQSLRHLVCR